MPKEIKKFTSMLRSKYGSNVLSTLVLSVFLNKQNVGVLQRCLQLVRMAVFKCASIFFCARKEALKLIMHCS